MVTQGKFFHFQEMQAAVYKNKKHDFCNLHANRSAKDRERREMQTKY